MAMRLSGLMSGMDTESIIQQLVSAKQTKVDKTKKAQTKLEWQQDAWKSLNTKLKNLQSKYLANMRFSDAYSKKTTKVSNANAVSVITGDAAMNGTQTLEVNKLAKTGYLTGAEVSSVSGEKVTALTKLSDLGVSGEGNFSITTDGKTTDIKVTGDSTISDVLTQLKNAGVNANFDENNKRFFVISKESGAASDFSITASDANGQNALSALGLQEGVSKEDVEILNKIKGNIDVLTDEDIDRLEVSATMKKYIASARDFASGVDTSDKASFAYDLINNAAESKGATKINGQDAQITLNGATFTSKDNVFAINGLTFTALSETKGEEVTVTTQQDTDGIYDMVKNFLKEYNEIVNEMDKLYNAASAKGYEPLTTEEKDALTDTEIEEYEKKIKDALLRRDSNLNTISSGLKGVMSAGVEINGKMMYLSDFGIETLGYFEAEDNEKNAYHIAGDPDDASTSGKSDKLKSLIANDPDTTIKFFTELSRNLYDKMSDMSKSVQGYRSFGSFYDDKKMKSDYDDYTTKIKEQEQKLNDYEDKWYKKFAAMETALSKMQSGANAVTSLLGGGS